MKGALCPICGNGRLVEEVGDFKAKLKDTSGEFQDLVVPGISWLHCENCKEDILDQTAEDAISTARRAALGLLSASQIRQFRTSLEKTQVAMSELLGVGEKTFCRWESGSHLQTEAFDRYLRLLLEEPSNVALLERIAARKKGDSLTAEQSPRVREIFIYLQDLQKVEESEERFLSAMDRGTLQCSHLRIN